MSFVKKAAKKVFKGVKKVVKKVWKPALIIGGTLLTAGMAAPGFAGFATSSGLGGFLGSVGSTIASGAGALLGTVGLGSAPGLLSPGAFGGLIGGGAGAAGGGLIGAGGIGSVPIAGVGSAGFAGGVTAGAGGLTLGATTAAGGGGILGALGGALSSATSGPLGKMMLFNGIQQGIGSFMASKEADRQRKREDQGFFFGGPRRGGSPEGEGIPQVATFKSPQQPAPGAQAQQAQQQAFAQGNTNQNLFQTGQMQPQQNQTPTLFQPGNLDLIGPDPQAQGIFGVA